MASRGVSSAVAEAWRWESWAKKKWGETVENRWAASWAIIMDPPWPIQ